jgi:hypothetical protein
LKKANLILGLILIINQSLKSQVYVPFPTENVYWNVFYAGTCGEAPPDSVLIRYTIHGDTIINEIQYSKLCVESGSTINPTIQSIGGLREAEKKIYYIGQTIIGGEFDDEYLLYDFTKQIGDTIKHDSYDGFKSVILDIDSVLIGASYRKRYLVNNHWFYHNPDYIIEGIGSVKNGLLGHISNIPTCGTHYWEHICFQLNEEVLFLNPLYDECFPSNLLSSTVLQWNETKIKIYPNPTTERLYINNNTNERELFIIMYDINGRIRLSTNLLEQNNINVLQLEKGVYVVKVTDQNGEVLATERIIKQ